MTTKDTMTNLQTLALAYAKALVAYHEAKNRDWCDRDRAIRRSYNELCDAQNALNDAAEAAAMV